jgi:regulator of RNase E activity RraA
MKKSVEELDHMVADLNGQVEVETQRAARARAEKTEEHQRAQKVEEQMEELNTETVRLNRTLEDKTQLLQKGMQEYTALNVKVI